MGIEITGSARPPQQSPRAGRARFEHWSRRSPVAAKSGNRSEN